jgi:isocitrate/isopropylmalate dehydrogenase
MRKKRYTVACLSGDGIGPEVMAEASRALADVSQLHGFSIEEQHVAFGGDAVRRFGHALPASTRGACRRADAVLVATTTEPAVEGIKAELDLTWRMTRVRLSGTRVTVVSPLADDARELAVQRAFDLACNRQARMTSVGASSGWRMLVDRAAEGCPGVIVEHASFESIVPALFRAPGAFDVIVRRPALRGGAVLHRGLRPRDDANGRVGPPLGDLRRHLRADARLGRGDRGPGRRESERDPSRGRPHARRVR